MDWDDFKFVQAVARTGSVRRAGELLNVHGSTVARHLDQLERRVGTRLFARTRRGMEVTPTGAQVMELLDRVADELDEVERSLKSRGPVLPGPISLAMPATVAGDLVMPELPGFFRDHPEVEMAVVMGDALEILQRGEADLALWMTDDPPEDLIGRPLGTIAACAYATPGCLEKLARGGSTDTACWVGSADPASMSARIRVRHFPRLLLRLRLDDVLLRAVALRAGVGVGLLPCYLGDRSAELVRAGTMEPVRLGDLWLFTRPEGRGVAAIQTVSAFLQETFARQRQRLEGNLTEKKASA